MNKLFYVTVAVNNKKLDITENIKHGIIATSKEDAAEKASAFGEVLYVHVETFELNEDWK